jgi:hypothetical protein
MEAEERNPQKTMRYQGSKYETTFEREYAEGVELPWEGITPNPLGELEPFAWYGTCTSIPHLPYAICTTTWNEDLKAFVIPTPFGGQR